MFLLLVSVCALSEGSVLEVIPNPYLNLRFNKDRDMYAVFTKCRSSEHLLQLSLCLFPCRRLTYSRMVTVIEF